jgi:hypothetical protein
MEKNSIRNKAALVLIVVFSLCFCSFAQSLRYFKLGFTGMADSEYMIAATSDPSVIAACLEQIKLPLNAKTKHINGLIEAGTGNNNTLYNWHFIPNQWGLAEISMELCDIHPTSITPPPIGTIRVCPWSSYVMSEFFPTASREKSASRETFDFTITPMANRILIHNGGSARQSVFSILDLRGKTLQSITVHGSATVGTDGFCPGTYVLQNKIDGSRVVIDRYVKIAQ